MERRVEPDIPRTHAQIARRATASHRASRRDRHLRASKAGPAFPRYARSACEIARHRGGANQPESQDQRGNRGNRPWRGYRRAHHRHARVILTTAMMNWLTGIHAVEEALTAGRALDRIVIASGRHGDRLETIVRLAKSRGVPVRFEDRQQVDRLAGTRDHQGVAALAAAKPAIDL